MSESTQPSQRSKDPVRIVYHAENRMFARLFNERSLEEVKDVVRRKLGLGRETNVSLKQMGAGTLLDLEDDDDFQAFCVLLGSSVSVDIQVTVGESQGSAVPPPVAPQPREQPSVSAPTTTLSGSPSRQPAGSAVPGQPSVYPEAARTTAAAATTEKMPETSSQKPKVSFGDAAPAALDKPPIQRSLKSCCVKPVASTETSFGDTAPAALGKRRRITAPRKVLAVMPDVSTGTSSDEAAPAALDKPPIQRALKSCGVKPVASTETSFGDTAPAALGKRRRIYAPRKVLAVRPIESPDSETSEVSVISNPVGAEEPPKKKQKKEVTKANEAKPTEAIESLTKASDVPKLKMKKSATLDRGSEAGTSAPKDAETSQPPVKKQNKQKKYGGTVPKKSSALVGTASGVGQSSNQSSNPVNVASLQSAPEKPGGSALYDDSKYQKSKKTKAIGVCASIPRTNASTSVQSEVAAAILSGCLSKASETIPPEPPAKRKSVKKDTKKSSASSSALAAKSTSAVDAPANEIPNIPTERRLENVVQTNRPPQQTPELNDPPCPICLELPFHIRYCCPIVLKGPDAIRGRLEELKRTNTVDQQSLTKELEGLLRDSKVTSKPSSDPAPTNSVESRGVSPPPNAALSRTPNIPSNSCLSEVTVESRNQGSSSESSDVMSEGGIEHKELPAPRRQQTPDEQPSLANDDLEAVIRGPGLKRQSILHVLDRIVRDDGDEVSGSEEDEAELEEDPDEETGRSGRQLSKRITRSSDSESEEEESKSSSPSRLAEGTSNNQEPTVQASNKPPEESAKHQDGDVVMKESVDTPVFEGQDGDSSEKTHVGSEDRMVVDQSIGEKGAAAIIEEQPSSPAPRTSVLQPLDAPSNELQESGRAEVNPTSDRPGGIPVASEDPAEIDVDPIEPADDLKLPTPSRSSIVEPIEAPSEDIGSLFIGLTQSTPNPGVTKRIKTRDGQIPDDEAEGPVLLEQLASETTEGVTPLSTKRKSRGKDTETPARQERPPTRKSPRFSSVPSSTSTPVAVVLLNHRAKLGTRSGKAAKTPAKRSEVRSDASQNSTRLAQTPSLMRWETLADPPSSPSLQQDEPSVYIDELMSSSPPSDGDPTHGRLNDKGKKGGPRKPVPSTQAESPQEKERLFDLSSSQIPFPYSQYQNNPAPTALPNERERGETTDSEEEPKLTKGKAKLPVQYRSLSQLASQAALFSPSLLTPANKSMTTRNAKNHVADEESSSSSSSDTDEANRSEHIPRGRRAGSVLETKKKKSLLSGF